MPDQFDMNDADNAGVRRRRSGRYHPQEVNAGYDDSALKGPSLQPGTPQEMNDAASAVVMPYGNRDAAAAPVQPTTPAAVRPDYSGEKPVVRPAPQGVPVQAQPGGYYPPHMRQQAGYGAGSQPYVQPQMLQPNDAAAYPSDYWQGYQQPHSAAPNGAYSQGFNQPQTYQPTGAQAMPYQQTGTRPPYQQTGTQGSVPFRQTGAQSGAPYQTGAQPGYPYTQTGRQTGFGSASQYSGSYQAQYSGQMAAISDWSGQQKKVNPRGENGPGYMMGSGEVPAWASQKPPKQASPVLDKLKQKLKQIKLPPIPKVVQKWLLIALIAVILVLGLTWWITTTAEKNRYEALVAEVTAYDSRFCQGVYVDGISLGGMSQQDAYNAVMAQAYNRNDSWSVQLTYQGEVLTEIRANQLGMKVDVKDAMNEAWLQGHTGSYEERKAAMDQLTVTPFTTTSSEPGGDTTVIDSILNGLANRLYEPASDAYMISFNPQLTEPFEFATERSGRCLNTEGLKERLYTMVADLESGTVEIELTELPPKTTVEQLKASQYAVRSVATTEISTSSDDNRNNNIRRAFYLISGTAIPSGGSFSFNNVVGERTERNGFYPAPEYVYGQVDTGIGGGVCQASTSIYQAAIYAGMNILTRYPHSMRVNYADVGKDATVYWYSNHRRDLVFQNPTAYPIYIKASVESKPNNRNRLITKVTIYGQPIEKGVTYNFILEEEVLPAPIEPEIHEDKTGQYVIYMDEAPYEFQSARDGVKVTSYRGKFFNGEEVERVLLATDTIAARPQILYTGVTDRLLETIAPPQ